MRTLLLVLFYSINGFASPKVQPIFDGEFNMDGPGCWLVNSKSEVIFYDDFNSGRIKIDSKIISLKPKSPSDNSGFKCGKVYEFSSEEKDISLSIKMTPSKPGLCLGVLRLKLGKDNLRLIKLKSVCEK